MLENLISNPDLQSEKLRNTAHHLFLQLEKSGKALEKIDDIPALEEIMLESAENLEALSNEWLVHEIKQQLAWTTDVKVDTGNDGL